MASIRTLGPGSLVIGEPESSKSFSADCTNVTLSPDTSTDDDINFLDGSTESGAQTTTWTLSGNIKENYSTDSLQVWCLTNAGQQLPFTFIPSNEGTLQITGKCVIAPVGWGGDVKAKNDQEFSFAASDIATAEISE